MEELGNREGTKRRKVVKGVGEAITSSFTLGEYFVMCKIAGIYNWPLHVVLLPFAPLVMLYAGVGAVWIFDKIKYLQFRNFVKCMLKETSDDIQERELGREIFWREGEFYFKDTGEKVSAVYSEAPEFMLTEEDAFRRAREFGKDGIKEEL